MYQLIVNRRDLRDARMAEVAQATVAEGTVRVRLDVFSLTANNITYAAMGEGPLGYWDFFPGPEGYGKPPCWGFATVVESKWVLRQARASTATTRSPRRSTSSPSEPRGADSPTARRTVQLKRPCTTST